MRWRREGADGSARGTRRRSLSGKTSLRAWRARQGRTLAGPRERRMHPLGHYQPPPRPVLAESRQGPSGKARPRLGERGGPAGHVGFARRQEASAALRRTLTPSGPRAWSLGRRTPPPPVVSFCGCETARSLALRPLPPVRPLALSRRACSRPLSYPPRVSRDASARLPCDFSTSLPLFPPIATFFAPLPTCRSGGHRRGPASATEQRRNHGTRGQGRPRARR